jgi:cytosine/adenosine deaminase-related metal-dependent hydrolase
VDRDPKGQLDAVFAIASRHGAGIDIHLHEPGEMGLFSLQEICARTRATGLQGRVAVSHGFCLGGITESKQKSAAEMMAKAGVTLVTHGAGGSPLPPIALLRGEGVTVICGNDDIRDTWSPYGTADMLERAAVIGWRADFRTDEALEALFEMISIDGARALGIAEHGVGPGLPANLFTLRAEGVPEAIGQHPPLRMVIFGGRVVARDGRYLG